MKKTLLCAALSTGFTGVAYSATSVTLYGVVDAGVGYQQTKITQGDYWRKSRTVDVLNGVGSGNRWGLKGTEDLGNGTSAIFELESGFDMGNGRSNFGGRLFGRHAYIGLTNTNWGTLTFGRLINLAADMVGPLNPFSVTYLQAGVLHGAFGSSVYARMDNAIKYETPNYNGFKLGLGYAGKSSKMTGSNGLDNFENSDTSNWITAGATYRSGPVTIAASYDRFRTSVRDLDSEIKDTTHMWNLFGAYDFELVKLYFGYGQIRGSMSSSAVVENGAGSTGLNGLLNDFTVTTNSTGLNYSETNGYRQQAWMIGVSVPVGNQNKVLFSYQGSATQNKEEAFDGAKGKLNILSFAYTHNLSKRTNLYALASYGSGKLTFDNRENVKLKSTLLGIGMTHRF